MGYDLKVFTGRSNKSLAQDICQVLDISIGEVSIGCFPDGEIHIQIDENVRGSDVFIVQSVCSNKEEGTSPNDALMELLILIDAARRASARRITAVLPYYGYARQDRKDRPRVPITAKLVANLIFTAGARRVLTLDLHANQIQGFFDIPVDHLYSINIFRDYLLQKNIQNPVVVSPDLGNIKMARAYAELMGAPLAVVDKRRQSSEKTEVLNIIGEVKGKSVVIIDDLISTGGSLLEAASALRAEGALEIYAAIIHPVLASPAIERVESSILSELVISNSIPVLKEACHGKIKVLSVAPILGEAIRRINNDESVSTLFSNAEVEG